MKFILIPLFFLFSLNSFSHCPIDFEEAELCADITWTDGPYDGKVSSFEVMFWRKGDASHTPVSPNLEIDIYSWMVMANGHSHGGPIMSYLELSEGIFLVQDARFFMGSMKGHWEVRIELTDLDSNLVALGLQEVPLNANSSGNGHNH